MYKYGCSFILSSLRKRWSAVRLDDTVVLYEKIMHIVLNFGRYTGISAKISVFYPKRYDKCKILPNIVLNIYGLIYRHVADILTDIQDEYIRYIVTWHIWGGSTNTFEIWGVFIKDKYPLWVYTPKLTLSSFIGVYSSSGMMSKMTSGI